MSRPVASPACRMRRTLCAASRPKAGCPVASRSNSHAPVDQLANVARTVLDQRAHGRLVAQAVAGRHRVAAVQLGAVVGAHRRGDAALRVARVALARRRLGEDEDTAERGERDGRAQAGDAAADDEKIGLRVHDAD